MKINIFSINIFILMCVCIYIYICLDAFASYSHVVHCVNNVSDLQSFFDKHTYVCINMFILICVCVCLNAISSYSHVADCVNDVPDLQRRMCHFYKEKINILVCI
jgi:hypothetical protein